MGVKMLKMTILFKLIVEIKKKTYISYVFMYMYVKNPQNGLRIKSNCHRAVAHCVPPYLKIWDWD